MLYIVKKWDAGIRGTTVGVVMGLEGWGRGGVGCGLKDIYSFTPGHLPTGHLPTWTLEINLRQVSCSVKCHLEFPSEEMSFRQNVFSMKCHVFLYLNVEQMK